MQNIAIFNLNNRQFRVEYSHASSFNRYCYCYNNDIFYLGCTNNVICTTTNGDTWELKDCLTYAFISKSKIRNEVVQDYLELIDIRKQLSCDSEDDYLLEAYLNYFYNSNLSCMKSSYGLKEGDIIYKPNDIFKVNKIKNNIVYLENTFDKDIIQIPRVQIGINNFKKY